MNSSKNRQLAAILFADIENYTSLLQKEEKQALATIQTFKESLQTTIPTYDGTILQFFGDGCLAIFPSSVDAMACAKILQEHFRSDKQVPVRMGLHVGDIVLQEGNAFGVAVNIAARLESMSIAGAILFSNTVNAHIANQSIFETVSLGKFTFKNVESRMEVFALANEGFPIPRSTELKGKVTKHRPKYDWLKKEVFSLGIMFLGAIAFWLPSTYLPVSTDLQNQVVNVVPFENHTGQDSLENVSKMILDWVAHGLAQVNQVSITTTPKSREQMDFAGMNSGLQAFLPSFNKRKQLTVKGAYYLEGKQLIIKSQLVNEQTQEIVYSLPDQVASTDRPLQAVRLLTEEIKDIWLDKNSD